MRVLREGGCARIHVVLGARSEEVRERAALPGCVLVDNPDWEQGMGRPSGPDSTRSPVRAPGPPWSRSSTSPASARRAVARVLGAHQGEESLVSAAYDGVRGHPVLFGAAHWAGIAATATGDRGARAYLKEHERAIALVECGDVARPFDIDTEADLAHLE
ncbi:4-diphosphocytidyl-2C-methyl-D-erythritol synthase [Streptomyces purpurascens]